MHVPGLILGVTLPLLVFREAFEVMLLPRRVRRHWRLMGIFFHFAWALWSGIGRQIKPRSERERFLSLFGPISLVGLFSIWAIGLVAGFGLLYWSLERHLPSYYDLGSYFYMSGTTLVTLGYGDFTNVGDASGLHLDAPVVGGARVRRAVAGAHDFVYLQQQYDAHDPAAGLGGDV